MVIQVGSAAIKKLLKNYCALELEATCIIWTLESLKFYLKGLAKFELWSNHAPLKDAIGKTMRELPARLPKFREAVEGYGMTIRHVKGASNLAADSMSRAPVGNTDEVEKVLNHLRGQGNYNYVCNRIVSSVQGDISEEVLEDPALDELWAAAQADSDYQLDAKVIAKKVNMKGGGNHEDAPHQAIQEVVLQAFYNCKQGWDEDHASGLNQNTGPRGAQGGAAG